ncbi:hypothetical protein TRFO_06802 [Tritrichomonas foetus]|uniref:Uncharacterized protein n=1 Tax=Tritrichomonas foetus TaxID=1144522 RepID=A0A1J4K0W6_9EUKA|nr:hypothetical protein TRFO_06802 [Tritrichomonas foetus]|eukprot:OHT03141.1 hypothetical protein TRFO_06802 [Tritrichomonas foetus]
MEFKLFMINFTFTIVGLSCIMGIVGLAVYMSHWYSLMNEEIWKEFFGKTDRNLGISASTFLTLTVITAVLSFSFEYTTHFLIVSGILQIPSIILTVIILTRLTDQKYENALELFKNNYYSDSLSMITFKAYELYLCDGLYNESLPNYTQTCSKTDAFSNMTACCDDDLNISILLRTITARNWMLSFFLCWIIGFTILLPISIIVCIKFRSSSRI